MGNTASDVSTSADFPAQLSNSFTVLAQNNNLTVLPGKYTITLSCIDELGTTQFGDFVGNLWFTSATAYRTTDPAGTPSPTPGGTTPTTPATPTTPVTPPAGAVATVTTLALSPPGSSAEGTAVQLNATVTPAAAAGTVTFTDGTGATAVTLGVAATSLGVAQLSIPLPAGGHSITAAFTPSASTPSYLPSASAAVAYTVTAAAGPPVVGALISSPATGSDVDPITFATLSTSTRASKGCPTPTTNIVGYVTGPGGWSGGILIVANTASDVSTSQDFVVQASNSFAVLAQNNSLTVLPGRYDIAVYCTDELGTNRYGRFSTSLWFTDTKNYQSTDPNSSQVQTETETTVSPADRADLGTKVTLSASITPATATGTIQFRNQQNGAFANLGGKVNVVGGKASYSSTRLGFGLYQLSAVFVPADAKRLKGSSSADVVFVMAKPLPPRPRTASATISGRARVGSTLTCAARFDGAKSLAYLWFRGRSEVIGEARTYRLTRLDSKKSVRCRVLATNTGGTTYRSSRAVVAR